MRYIYVHSFIHSFIHSFMWKLKVQSCWALVFRKKKPFLWCWQMSNSTLTVPYVVFVPFARVSHPVVIRPSDPGISVYNVQGTRSL